MDIITAFASPKLLLNWAHKQARDVEAEITDIVRRQVRTVTREPEPDSPYDIVKVHIAPQNTDMVNLLVKDALGTLRDALDHAVYAAAAVLGSTHLNRTAFPIGRDMQSVRGELGSARCKGVPHEIHSFLLGLRPYEGGNGLLFGLNHARNANTHRVVTSVLQYSIANQTMISNGHVIITHPGPGIVYLNRWNAEKNEIECFLVTKASKFYADVNVTTFITFGDVKVLAGKEVVATLREIAREVEGIILGLEVETSRIAASRQT